MNTILSNQATLLQPAKSPQANLLQTKEDPGELRDAFDRFVGETFYGQMLKSLRSLTKEPPYFHGGQAEDIFRDELDQVLAENLTQSTAHNFTGPMFDLFQLQRS